LADIAFDKPRSAADWAAMREICCDTAARPVPPGERDAFGRLWIDPYERWAPEWAYVARAEGKVVGYLTGCRSSVPFFAKAFAFGPRPKLGANLRFPASLLARLARGYPAHLHVNVREGYRGGTGRALVSRFEEEAAADGARGVHLFCGARPVGFYRKAGYEELGRLQVGEAWIYAMGKRLPGR
jgi:hypothetical protein